MTTSNSGYHGDLFGAARASDDFRQVLATAAHTQLVIMTLPPGGEIGAEVHHGIDQILIAVDGAGESVVDGVKRPMREGHAVVVPEGVEHNIVNTGDRPLRLVTVYGPPDHRPGTVHHTRADAERDELDVPPPA
ncbi:cupin domain-containing protein [Pilimelia columellifera]|uniref:Cupin domain-containing protein n=1 Tax=Pilimelia columellifera subsp. columellifera TaxID=706583 RepID=A0ABN3N128_9ACTN